MDARVRLLSPVVTLSTRASPRLRLTTFARVAIVAHLDGLDVDLSERLPVVPSDVIAAVERYAVPVRSVWVPNIGPWTNWRREHVTDAAATIARASRAAMLVVDLSAGGAGKPVRAAITASTIALRSSLRAETRMCVAVRARQLEGGRAHLVEMTALRRLAEEWDFEIALDLTGPIDPRWEAEAAVARLGARLRLIRLETEVASGPAHGRGRMATRAFSAAIDGGHAMEFALVPRCPIWRWNRAGVMTGACDTAGRRVRARFAAVEAQRVADAYPPPFPKHRGQRQA